MCDPGRPARARSGARHPPNGLPTSREPRAVPVDPHIRPYASCAKGLEAVLSEELTALGIPEVRRQGSGVSFGGGLEAAYRVCLQSRVANRVLWPLHRGDAATPDALYQLVREVDWSEHVGVDGSLAVDFFSSHSAITHTQFGALKVKDAVVDQFREATGSRPNVDRTEPDLRINVYVYRNQARLALDLSGNSLHRRGYRGGGGLAPVKETIAAALLLRADWPRRATEGQGLVDPLCGSGTLVIEAACMAAHRAPGLGRTYFGFLGWRGHDAALWQRLVADAQVAVQPVSVPLRGHDQDETAVRFAREGFAATGLEGDVHFSQSRVEDAADAGPAGQGLLISNPPWGERLATSHEEYKTLGRAFSTQYAGWDCALFASRQAPFGALGLPLREVLSVANGGVDCHLSLGRIPARRGSRSQPPVPDADVSVHRAKGPPVNVQPLINRLTKNLSSSRGWRRQQGIRAHRVYDADLPEFAVAIDLFDCGENGDDRHLVVQEYAAPRSVNAAVAAERLQAVLAALPEVFDVDAEQIHLKKRERQRGAAQYDRQRAAEYRRVAGSAHVLLERDIRYELNFTDYLDVGLFLDHRRVRQYVRDWFVERGGGHFLNLFSYTASATLSALHGGATSSLSVDLSRRYCEWAERNLAANAADPSRHSVCRADVLSWLAEGQTPAADLILLDPPTHSNSRSTERDWSVQADHVAAIDASMNCLAPEGVLIFSNNFRGFRLDAALEERYIVEDRSSWSLSRDFKRNTRIHRCWFIKRRAA